VSDCIVIAVLNGIEISHKLFMPEMVPDVRAIRGCESVLGMPLCIPSAVVDYQLANRYIGDLVQGLFALWYFRSSERKFQLGTFAPGSESSREHLSRGAIIPGSKLYE